MSKEQKVQNIQGEACEIRIPAPEEKIRLTTAVACAG